MRIAPLAPAEVQPDLRAFHDLMAADVERYFSGFIAKREDGALIGPYPPLIRFPQFGQPVWAFIKALIEHSTLPKAAHEVAILVTGATFGARYEIYAHEYVAEQVGLARAKVATIAAGERPSDLDAAEAAAYDAAAALSRGKMLPASSWEAVRTAFGDAGAAELAFLVAGYCMLSVLFNAFDLPVPTDT